MKDIMTDYKNLKGIVYDVSVGLCMMDGRIYIIVRNGNDTAKLDFTDEVLLSASKFIEQWGYGDKNVETTMELPNGWLSFVSRQRGRL